MRRLLGFLVPLLAAIVSVPRPTFPSKPVAPIELKARLLGDPASGCAVEASASAGGRDVELEIVLPEGVEPGPGPRKGAGKRVHLRVDARAPERKRREILVRATIREGGAVLTRVLPLVIHDAPAVSQGTRKTGPRGEPVLEFAP